MPCADPHERAHAFTEVALGYPTDTAVEEANRCIVCKNRPCIAGCPVEIDIPKFVEQVAQQDFEGAWRTLTDKNQVAHMSFTLEIPDIGTLSRILALLDQIPNVMEVRRKTS